MNTISRIALVAPPANMHVSGWVEKEISHVQLLHATHLGRHSKTFIGENLGLHLAAAALAALAYETRVFDACLNEWNFDELTESILDFKPDCICIFTLDGVLDEISVISKRLAHLGALLVAVGPAAINNGNCLIEKTGVDMVWRGDAAGFAGWLSGKLPLNATVPFRDHPRPSRADSKLAIEKQFTLGIASSRGCSFGQCGFCTIASNSKIQGYRWESRDAHDVVREFRSLRDTYHPKWITFADGDFIGDTLSGIRRAECFAQQLISDRNETPFMFDCRVDQLDRTLLLHLMEAGLQQVFVGIEHNTSASMGALTKGLTPSVIEDRLDMLKEIGLSLIPGYIVFLPWESPAQVLDSFRFFRSLNYYDLWRGTSFLRYYPGTPLATDVSVKPEWQVSFECHFAKFLKTALVDLVNLDMAHNRVKDSQVTDISRCHFDIIEQLLECYVDCNSMPPANECEDIVLSGLQQLESVVAGIRERIISDDK